MILSVNFNMTKASSLYQHDCKPLNTHTQRPVKTISKIQGFFLTRCPVLGTEYGDFFGGFFRILFRGFSHDDAQILTRSPPHYAYLNGNGYIPTHGIEVWHLILF